MTKHTAKWLAGTGLLALSALGLAAAIRSVTARMVSLALDRKSSAIAQKHIARISGSQEGAALTAFADLARCRLEKAGCETVTVTSHDSLPLVGHWRPSPAQKRVIVAMHGWRGGWSRDFGLVADFWYENGCSVLYAEQRGQGESGGEYMGFGLLERHDCVQWARWAAAKVPEGTPVYLAGVSMGATTVLMAGGMELPGCIRGIMADCGFTSAWAIWKHVAQKNLHLHYGLYAAAANDLCKKKLRLDAREYSTVDALRECEVPVLLIHGSDDRFVPVEMTYENYKACASPKRLLIVPGADHGLSFLMEPALYQRAMLEFWQSYDRGPSPANRRPPEAPLPTQVSS